MHGPSPAPVRGISGLALFRDRVYRAFGVSLPTCGAAMRSLLRGAVHYQTLVRIETSTNGNATSTTK